MEDIMKLFEDIFGKRVLNDFDFKNDILIHQGSNRFDDFRYLEISNNRIFTKPNGGIWCCPYRRDSKFKSAWEEWNDMTNTISKEYLSNYFLFRVKEDTRVLKLDDEESFDEIKREYSMLNREFIPDCDKEILELMGDYVSYLDFEEIKKDYDLIYFTDNSNYVRSQLQTWDLESVLILNKNVIEIIEG